MTAEAALELAPARYGRRPSAARVVVVALAYLAILAVSAVYPLTSPLRDASQITPEGQLTAFVQGVVWLLVLLAAMIRQPDGRLWKLLLAWLLALRISTLSWVPDSLVWSVAQPLEILALALFVHFVVAYPSGRLRDRFDRAVVAYTYVFLIGTTVARRLLWDPFVGCNPDCVRNLFVVRSDWELANFVDQLQVIVGIVTIAPLVLVVLWRHWHSARPAARRTLLPVVVAVPIQLAALSVDVASSALGFEPGIEFFASSAGTVVHLLVPLVLPIGLLIALVRSRLGRGRIADLVVELGAGVPLGGLRDVLARTLGDPTLQLAFAAPSGTGYVDAAGQPVELPVGDPGRRVTRLEGDGELLGVLVHDPEVETEDPGLVEAVGNAARLALANERLAAEVRAQLEEVHASRARIVEATDAERRRVERDLHDGAQQRLVALAMRLQLARQANPAAGPLLDEATAELETAIGEVRDLARGVHPTILSEAGLSAAIDSLAERTPLPVAVDVTPERFSQRIEATTYFVVAEALTNVVRSAAASRARVSIRPEDGGNLVVTVADDGRGGADPSMGSGLRGLADRVAAVGGRVDVVSPTGGGTTVSAVLPAEPYAPPVLANASAPAPRVEARAIAPQSAARRRQAGPVGLMLLVAGGIAVIAVAAGQLSADQPPVDGRAEEFGRPFVYRVPADSQFVLYDGSEQLNVLSEPPGTYRGISIWIVGDVLADPCEHEPIAPVVAREPGVDGLLTHLRSMPRLVVGPPETRSVDGRAATRVVLTVADQESGCPDDGSLLLWRETAPGSRGVVMQVPEQNRVPVTFVDVDDATVAIEVWAGDPADFERWEPIADKIVASFRFLRAPASSP